jgi:hypothetical protein
MHVITKLFPYEKRLDFVHIGMSVGVFWAVDLFSEIPARLGRWNAFLSPPFIRISKQNEWLEKYLFGAYSLSIGSSPQLCVVIVLCFPTGY